MRVWGPMDCNLERNLLAIAEADWEDWREVVLWKSRAPAVGVNGRIVSVSVPGASCAVVGLVTYFLTESGESQLTAPVYLWRCARLHLYQSIVGFVSARPRRVVVLASASSVMASLRLRDFQTRWPLYTSTPAVARKFDWIDFILLVELIFNGYIEW